MAKYSISLSTDDLQTPISDITKNIDKQTYEAFVAFLMEKIGLQVVPKEQEPQAQPEAPADQ